MYAYQIIAKNGQLLILKHKFDLKLNEYSVKSIVPFSFTCRKFRNLMPCVASCPTFFLGGAVMDKCVALVHSYRLDSMLECKFLKKYLLVR